MNVNQQGISDDPPDAKDAASKNKNLKKGSNNVVRLNVEPIRPIEATPPGQNQTNIAFMAAVPTEDDLEARLAKAGKAFYAKKDADNPTDKPKWVRDIIRERNQTLTEVEMRASATSRPATAKPDTGKLPPKSRHPSRKKGKAQESLPFDSGDPPAVRSTNDQENTPLEVAPNARLVMKDELLAMELPLFSLSKKPDTKARSYPYQRKNGHGAVTVSPSIYGQATIFDNDLLIYCASVIDDLVKRGLPPSRTLLIDTTDFLRKTRRGYGGAYERILDMLRRLQGTFIETDIPTGGFLQTKMFGLIEGAEILRKKERLCFRKNSKTGKEEPCEVVSVLKFSVTLSEWQYNSIRHEENHVRDIDEAYFALDSAIERRLYQIALHHCASQPLWKIDIEHLAKKVGTRGQLFKFREDIRNAIRDDRLPGYHIALDSQAKPNMVVFYQKTDGLKNDKKAEINRTRSDALMKMKGNGFEWFESLERPSSSVIKSRLPSQDRREKQNNEAAARKTFNKSGSPKGYLGAPAIDESGNLDHDDE